MHDDDLKDPALIKRYHNYLMLNHGGTVKAVLNSLKHKSLIPQNINEEDLHSVGQMAIYSALSKHTPEVGKLSPFLYRTIYGAMLEHIHSQGDIPKYLKTKARNIAAQERQKQNENSPPTPLTGVSSTPTQPVDEKPHLDKVPQLPDK